MENALENVITDAQLQFIVHLNDTSKTYSRFIDALLISRPQHAAFFRDLRCFRSQPSVISTLQACDATHSSSSRDQVKQRYRQTTRLFLQSRWSHPWCRIAGANKDTTLGSPGWWGAEWSATGRKMQRKEQEAENRLHQLLLPMWVIMRARMFPGDEMVDRWWSQRKREMACQTVYDEVNIGKEVEVYWEKFDVNHTVQEVHLPSEDRPHNPSLTGIGRKPSSNPFQENGGYALRQVKTTANLREEFWNSAEGQKAQKDLQRQEQESAAAATTAFRLIATGMLLNTIPRWKLKRVLKVKH